ncbi:MAG: 1-deoxy-D-xylulose-5-phosphate reductoisomerase, partial [Muribaculaceae bacterium]|nr:1-deoxy-D-xylulose-5-phosphate reductoisomerase [Muribaculaceae bacterium]
QSIVHSMVEFVDGSIKAQLGVPDMHLPIRYALGYPERLPTDTPPLSLAQYATLTFEAPDYDKFPLLGFAFEAIEEGGNMPCILNAANEKGVAAFLEGRIRFTDMPLLVADVMKTTTFIPHPSLDDLILTNTEALKRADDWLAHNS